MLVHHPCRRIILRDLMIPLAMVLLALVLPNHFIMPGHHHITVLVPYIYSTLSILNALIPR
jgi:hypothetical protein